MKTIKLLILSLTMIFLSACASMNSSYDCPNKAGVSCKSLDEINAMVETGQLTGKRSDAKGVNNAEFEYFPSAYTSQPGEPVRYGETVQRIWVAPYEDNDELFRACIICNRKC